ncbi:MAG: hypothetical protein QXN37_02945 [Candidatus Anstonellaceae archaeon]
MIFALKEASSAFLKNILTCILHSVSFFLLFFILGVLFALNLFALTSLSFGLAASFSAGALSLSIAFLAAPIFLLLLSAALACWLLSGALASLAYSFWQILLGKKIFLKDFFPSVIRLGKGMLFSLVFAALLAFLPPAAIISAVWFFIAKEGPLLLAAAGIGAAYLVVVAFSLSFLLASIAEGRKGLDAVSTSIQVALTHPMATLSFVSAGIILVIPALLSAAVPFLASMVVKNNLIVNLLYIAGVAVTLAYIVLLGLPLLLLVNLSIYRRLGKKQPL